jgi:CheY-like chemotaxis protein
MDLRALLVCPDQDSSNLLTQILSELGMSAEHAPSISQALQLIDLQRFDCVVFDYLADQASEQFLQSWRRSTWNRDSLLVAILDADFNARPVFGLGANFVLYRPLSSERTRISLRAARNLIRRERRRGPRIRLDSTVNVAYPGAPETAAKLSDLSDGGTLIQSKNRLPALGKAYFEFSLPGQRQLVRLAGEVAWQDASGRTGIRFVNVPQASRRLIQGWLQSNGATGVTTKAAGVDGAQNADSRAIAPETPACEGQFAAPKNPILQSNSGNRRGERRFTCKLGAEVYRLGVTVPNRCNLSDISEGGCYVEMPSPFANQSGVEILVRTSDAKLRIRGQVINTHPGFGMGVRFMFRDSVEREEVLRLMAILASGPSLKESRY